jgi:hypothetical protein
MDAKMQREGEAMKRSISIAEDCCSVFNSESKIEENTVFFSGVGSELDQSRSSEFAHYYEHVAKYGPSLHLPERSIIFM